MGVRAVFTCLIPDRWSQAFSSSRASPDFGLAGEAQKEGERGLEGVAVCH